MEHPLCPEIPGHPLHLIQRGHLHAPVFFSHDDRVSYMRMLGECAAHSGCAIHAYVLMGNHVHLLVTPSREGSAAELMRSLAESYAEHVAKTHGRDDPLWEEGFEAIPAHVGRYVIACMRYIELNPLRARLVAKPGQYRWSSFKANALGESDPLLTPHSAYAVLGRSPAARQTAYLALFQNLKKDGETRRATPRSTKANETKLTAPRNACAAAAARPRYRREPIP